ncbi:MAG TPA: cupin domain-containing protein [Ruminiclostridium sp.]
MSEQIKLIATRIKDLREISEMTVPALAAELQISEETYLSYESGDTDIPVSFLYQIANRFNVELAAILTGDAPKLHTYQVVRKGKGASVERREHYKYHNLANNFIGKRAEPFIVTVSPEAESSSVHFNSHKGQEFNYIIEGAIKIIINGHELILEEGDSVYFDSSANHGMKALNSKQAKFLAIIL